MDPTTLSALLTALAALVVVATRLRLSSVDAGHAKVPGAVSGVHTAAGVAAVGSWAAMLVTQRELLGWVALPLWWLTALAGLLILLMWLPSRRRGRRAAAEETRHLWGEGPGLAILAFVGTTVAVAIFTFFLVFDLLPS